MYCVRDEYKEPLVSLGSVEPGKIIVFLDDENAPFLVTDRVRNDEVGAVNCNNGRLYMFSDRTNCICASNATLIWRLNGNGDNK